MSTGQDFLSCPASYLRSGGRQERTKIKNASYPTGQDTRTAYPVLSSGPYGLHVKNTRALTTPLKRFCCFLPLLSESRAEKNMSERVSPKSLMEAFEKFLKTSQEILSNSFSLPLVNYGNFSKNIISSQSFGNRLTREQSKYLIFT